MGVGICPESASWATAAPLVAGGEAGTLVATLVHALVDAADSNVVGLFADVSFLSGTPATRACV